MLFGALSAIFAQHHGFKDVNVRAADFGFLFHLDGIPRFVQGEFGFLLLACEAVEETG
jgi:hypothetical protein